MDQMVTVPGDSDDFNINQTSMMSGSMDTPTLDTPTAESMPFLGSVTQADDIDDFTLELFSQNFQRPPFLEEEVS